MGVLSMNEITVCKNKIILPNKQPYLKIEDIPFYLAKTQYPSDADRLKRAGVEGSIEDNLRVNHYLDINADNPLTKMPSEQPRQSDIVYPDNIVSYAKEFCKYDIEVVRAEPYIIDIGKSVTHVFVWRAINNISYIRKLTKSQILDDLKKFAKMNDITFYLVKEIKDEYHNTTIGYEIDNSRCFKAEIDSIENTQISIDDLEKYVIEDGGEIIRSDDDYSKFIEKISRKRMSLGEACYLSAWGASQFPYYSDKAYNIDKQFNHIYLSSIDVISEFKSKLGVIADRYKAARKHIKDIKSENKFEKEASIGGDFKFDEDEDLKDFFGYTVDTKEFMIWCHKSGFDVNPDVWEHLFPVDKNSNKHVKADRWDKIADILKNKLQKIYSRDKKSQGEYIHTVGGNGFAKGDINKIAVCKDVYDNLGDELKQNISSAKILKKRIEEYNRSNGIDIWLNPSITTRPLEVMQ